MGQTNEKGDKKDYVLSSQLECRLDIQDVDFGKDSTERTEHI